MKPQDDEFNDIPDEPFEEIPREQLPVLNPPPEAVRGQVRDLSNQATGRDVQEELQNVADEKAGLEQPPQGRDPFDIDNFVEDHSDEFVDDPDDPLVEFPDDPFEEIPRESPPATTAESPPSATTPEAESVSPTKPVARPPVKPTWQKHQGVDPRNIRAAMQKRAGDRRKATNSEPAEVAAAKADPPQPLAVDKPQREARNDPPPEVAAAKADPPQPIPVEKAEADQAVDEAWRARERMEKGLPPLESTVPPAARARQTQPEANRPKLEDAVAAIPQGNDADQRAEQLKAMREYFDAEREFRKAVTQLWRTARVELIQDTAVLQEIIAGFERGREGY